MFYCICSAGGAGQIVERSVPPTPEEAIYITGPYDTFERATLECIGVTCPQGWWCACGRRATQGLAKVVYYPAPPEWYKYQINIGPHNTAEQAKVLCVDPVPNTNPMEYEYKTCRTVTTVPAFDICKPDSTISIPVTLECSLACTPLGYPMTMGVAMMNFFSSDCISVDPERSRWIDHVISVGLSCLNQDPVQDGIWVGEYVTGVGAPGVPGKGFTIRIRLVMTVVDAVTLSLNISLYRLVPGSEQNPPTDVNSWTGCNSTSILLYRTLGPGVDPNDRTINQVYTSDLVPFLMNGVCATDVRFISVGIVLTPWRFGCDGTADAGVKIACNLPSGNFSYSCFRVSVQPRVQYNQLYNGPAFSQLGVNSPNCGGEIPCGCYKGYTTLPWGGTINPPSSQVMSLLRTGCSGELPVLPATIGGEQSIQYGTAGGYGIVIKTINKGNLCLAVSDSVSNTYYRAGEGDSTYESYAGTDHIVGRAYFPSLVGKPEVIFYAMKFPNPEITGCIHDIIVPPVLPPPPNNSLIWDTEDDPLKYANSSFSYLQWQSDMSSMAPVETMPTPVLMDPTRVAEDATSLIAQIKTRFQKTCVYLGKEIPNTGCCGTSNQFECSKFGKCRRYGMSPTGEPVCGVCPEFKE